MKHKIDIRKLFNNNVLLGDASLGFALYLSFSNFFFKKIFLKLNILFHF